LLGFDEDAVGMGNEALGITDEEGVEEAAVGATVGAVEDMDDNEDTIVKEATRSTGAGPVKGSVQLKVSLVIEVQHCQS
jgi:hypothetical protein